MSIDPLSITFAKPLKRPREASDLDEKVAAIFNKASDEIRKEFSRIDKLRFRLRFDNLAGPFYSQFCLDKKAILTAAPDQETLDDFLEMIFKHSDKVFMLVKTEECIDPREAISYFDVKTEKFLVVRKDVQAMSDEIDSSVLEITDLTTKETKFITHLHYNCWVDAGAGDSVVVAQLARSALGARMATIHCKAGIGRTGTLALTMAAYKRIIEGEVNPEVFPQALLNLRRERTGCVMTPAQYETAFKAVRILLREDRALAKKECITPI